MWMRNHRVFLSAALFQLIALFWAAVLFSYPVAFKDASGNELLVEKRPARVVSLVPSITEILMEIGAGDALQAITYHDTSLRGTGDKEVVGGFYSPDLGRIEEIRPDVIFYSDLQKDVPVRFKGRNCILINLETLSIKDSYRNILLLGRIFNAEDRAEGIVRKIETGLELIGKKVKTIPLERRKRVIRIMGSDRDRVMTPGEGSFQNEMIELAGGIPPRLKKAGQVAPMTLKEWTGFNPQVIYTCGGYKEVLSRLLSQPGWKDVEAVQEGNIFDFPCDLTCRAATNTGYFVAWLSARIYGEEYSSRENQVTEDAVIASRDLDVPLNYVKDARILYSNIRDFPNKTLLIDFKRPMAVVSTLEGYRKGIQTVGNHYSSLPGWIINHDLDLACLRSLVYGVINRPEAGTSILFTGADMDNLSIKQVSYREMEVYGIVTAGVQSNGLRMSKDIGGYYEPGTINIILLTSRRLTPRAMTRAIISATEGKSAALQDMDIRSSQTPMINQATGTGTDNIIVVEGEGKEIDGTGGHTKMGELIAKAVYEGVQEAIYKQNGISRHRNVFQRLMERKISMFGLISLGCDCGAEEGRLTKALEELLLDPVYASFIESSLALSDAYEKGLVSGLGPYRLWCKEVAEEIAGKEVDEMIDLVNSDNIPIVIRMSLNALLNGLYYKE